MSNPIFEVVKSNRMLFFKSYLTKARISYDEYYKARNEEDVNETDVQTMRTRFESHALAVIVTCEELIKELEEKAALENALEAQRNEMTGKLVEIVFKSVVESIDEIKRERANAEKGAQFFESPQDLNAMKNVVPPAQVWSEMIDAERKQDQAEMRNAERKAEKKTDAVKPAVLTERWTEQDEWDEMEDRIRCSEMRRASEDLTLSRIPH